MTSFKYVTNNSGQPSYSQQLNLKNSYNFSLCLIIFPSNQCKESIKRRLNNFFPQDDIKLGETSWLVRRGCVLSPCPTRFKSWRTQFFFSISNRDCPCSVGRPRPVPGRDRIGPSDRARSFSCRSSPSRVSYLTDENLMQRTDEATYEIWEQETLRVRRVLRPPPSSLLLTDHVFSSWFFFVLHLVFHQSSITSS